MDSDEKFDVAKLGTPIESGTSDRDRNRRLSRYGDRGKDRE